MPREAEQREGCWRYELAEERLRFHRLTENEEGHMIGKRENEELVRVILDRVDADAVVLPHGSDTNADHRRTFWIFDSWAREQERAPLALLVRDTKTVGMYLDLVTTFGEDVRQWKGELLRCHASQHERNLWSCGYGLDKRILEANRQIASKAGVEIEFARGVKVCDYWEGL